MASDSEGPIGVAEVALFGTAWQSTVAVGCQQNASTGELPHEKVVPVAMRLSREAWPEQLGVMSRLSWYQGHQSAATG